MSELSKHQQELVDRVHHPRVMSGAVVTTYHLHDYWERFDRLDPTFMGFFEYARDFVKPKYPFEPESAAVLKSGQNLALHVVYESDSSTPMVISILKPPSIKLQDVFYEEVDEIMKRTPEGYAITTPDIFYVPDNLSHLPQDSFPVTTRVAINPFNFYTASNPSEISGNDPFRFEMVISGVTTNVRKERLLGKV